MQKFKILFIIILALFALLLLSGVGLHLLYRKLDKANSYKAAYESVYKQAETWKDESGKWRSKAEAIEVTNSELINIKEFEKLREDYKDIKKSLKNLENYNKIGSTTIINNTTHIKDTIFFGKDSTATKASVFSYKNKFENIYGVIKGDSIDWTIEHRDSLEIVQYWDRTWFLAKKKYFTEIKSANPNTKIDYQKSIKSKRKKGLFRL